MQLHFRQIVQKIRHLLELDPVVLNVLAGGEMRISAIVGLGDVGELFQLRRGQRAVGDRNAQHVGMELQIQPIHQTQRTELVFAQFAGEAALHLAAEFRDALADDGVVEFVVDIHGSYQLARRARSGRTVGPTARICSRRRAGLVSDGTVSITAASIR